MSTEVMSGKERILAALRKQEVDRPPLVPLIVAYSLADWDESAPHFIPDVFRAAGLDIYNMPMGDGLCAWLPLPDSGIKQYTKWDNGDQLNYIETPVGTIYERCRTGVNASLNPQVKHMIETPEDLKIYKYVLEHQFPYYLDLSYEYNWECSKIGDDGVNVCTAFQMTPIKHFIELAAGVENTYYLMADEPELFDEVMEIMQQHNVESYRQVLERSKCEIFGDSENTSWTTMSPSLFAKYCVPQLNEYSDIIHQHGKLHVVHMCGKLSKFENEMKAVKFDAIGDMAPAPTGDTEIWEGAERWPELAFKGGIECTEFSAKDSKVVYDKTTKILEKTSGRKGILIGSGDSVPCGVTMENFKAMRRAVDDFYGIK